MSINKTALAVITVLVCVVTSVSVADDELPPFRDFPIADWRPLSDHAVREAADFLVEMEDQNGCRFILFSSQPEQLRAQSLVSIGVGCNDNGYAAGSGSLMLQRPDGVQHNRTHNLTFSHGFPLGVRLHRRGRLAAFDDDHNLWFYLAGDKAGHTHFLRRAEALQQGLIGFWNITRIDAVTDNEEAFRDPEQVTALIDAALKAQQKAEETALSAIHIVFSLDFARGAVADQRDYQALILRGSRSIDGASREPTGEWQFDRQWQSDTPGLNLALQRDQLHAERERQQRWRGYVAQKRNLEHCRELQEMAENEGPEALREYAEIDLRIGDISSGDPYHQLLWSREEGSGRFRRIARVAGHDGDDALVDWPHDIRLEGQAGLEKGWYWIAGEQRLDPERSDSEDLPLTVVTADEQGITPCEERGCRDQLTAAAIMRLVTDDPQWTAEGAQMQINAWYEESVQ